MKLHLKVANNKLKEILIVQNNSMNIENIKEFFGNIIKNNYSNKVKVYVSASLAWMILIGYLTWWNGLKSPTLDKGFRWDEWFWFGFIPATVPYLFYFIWKKKD